MKAIVQQKYGGPEVLKLSDVATPEPSDHEVLVKVHYAAVNDYEWCMMRGTPFLYRLMFGLFIPRQPIPGMELSGTVEKTGSKVQTFQRGDAVYGDLSDVGFGALAECVAVHEKALRLKPENISFEAAAATPHAGNLAVQGLINLGKIKPGENVLINGAGGGVGVFALQIAKTYNAKVTGVDTGEKLTTMKKLGFDQVIDFKQIDVTQISEQFDIILDTKTVRSPLKFLSILKPHGRYVTVGGDLSRILQTAVYAPFVKFLSSKSLALLALKPNQSSQVLERLYHEDKLQPEIDGPYPLEKSPELIQYFGEGKHTGKIVIQVSN